MGNKNGAYYVEEPRDAGTEAEFFLQTAPPNSLACGLHIHNAVELLYVVDGSYRVLLDNEEYRIGRGDLILFCSNSLHNVFSEEEPRNGYYVIKIPPAFFMEFSRREKGAEYIMRFAPGGAGKRVLWRAEELAEGELLPILNTLIGEYEEQRYACEIAIRLKVMELLLAILREGDPVDDPPPDHTVASIYGIMIGIGSDYAADIDERELARSVGMSYSHFSRSFKRVSGMTFKRYLNLTRVNKAEQMLYTGKDSITDVAARCGFNSTSYFIKTYKSITGKTPYSTRRKG